MSGIAAVFTVLCVIFGAWFSRSCEKRLFRRAFWLKGLAGLCFVAVGLSLAIERAGLAFPRLIFFGLVMGLIGDELLALRRLHEGRGELFYACGAAAFAAGHVLYLRAMWTIDSGAWLFALPIFAIGYALAGAYILRQKVELGKLLVPGIVYIALVVAVAAMGTALLVRGQETRGLLLAMGGTCFAVSDSLLCVHRFGPKPTAHQNRVVHAIYYAAQLLIAWSIATIY